MDNKIKLTITVLENGVTEKAVLVVGAGPDADFDKEGDNAILEAKWTRTKGGVVVGTGVFLKTSVANDTDTLKSASIEFVINPGQDLKSDADDLCYAIHIVSDKRFGLERHSEFHFISAAPFPHGQEPTAGTFSGQADYANGKSITLKGSFSPEGFEAEYTGPDGTATLKWSKSGIVL